MDYKNSRETLASIISDEIFFSPLNLILVGVDETFFANHDKQRLSILYSNP